MRGKVVGVWRRRAVIGLVDIVILVGFALTLHQPWLEQWGSTPAEQTETFPGDDIAAGASAVYTRSISIAAPPSEVWPWLVQMGQDKAGFYSFDWAETLFTDPMRNASTIHPEWQQLEVGDLVHPFPPERGLASWRVRQLEPEQFLMLATDDDDWSLAFDLRAASGGQTRLVSRFRSEPNWMNVALGPADLIVFPRLLVGVQQRAEGTLPGLPGVPTGAPLPTARLPVHWWAAGLWLVGLASLGAVGSRFLSFGDWRRPRPHPGITITIAFVAGAGYAIMSDTPPTQFIVRNWAFGLAAALLLALAVGRSMSGPPTPWLRRAGRAVVAFAEAGLFVVLPVTAVWQAATAQGWADGLGDRAAVSLLAIAAGVFVAAIGTRRTAGGPLRFVTITAMAAGYVSTGSALVPLGGAALLELVPSHRPIPLTATVDVPPTTVEADRLPVPN